MYLSILEENGYNIKGLASDYLSEKYGQPANIIWCKIMSEEKQFDDVRAYNLTDIVNDELVTTTHIFDDFSYATNDVEGDDIKTFKGFDLAWFNIIYSSLHEISSDIADEYMTNARFHLEKACSSYKDEVEEVAKFEYDLAVKEATRIRSEALTTMVGEINSVKGGFNALCESFKKEEQTPID